MSTTTMSSGLTAAQREFFRENGYLVLESLLSTGEVRELREASERLQGIRDRLGGGDRLAVIKAVTLRHPAFAAAARHPKILDAVADLIGPNLRLQHSKLNWKPPAIGKGEVHWHQDYPFFPHTNFDLVACMVLLDDAVPENGCMRMIPGGHRLGPLDHWVDGRFAGRIADTSAFDESTAVDLIAPAGSVTIHHCLIPHASYPNRSPNPRRGLVYQIAAADAVQLGGNLHKDWGMLLHGEEPLVARLEGALTLRLPARLINQGGLPVNEDPSQAIDD